MLVESVSFPDKYSLFILKSLKKLKVDDHLLSVYEGGEVLCDLLQVVQVVQHGLLLQHYLNRNR